MNSAKLVADDASETGEDGVVKCMEDYLVT